MAPLRIKLNLHQRGRYTASASSASAAAALHTDESGTFDTSLSFIFTMDAMPKVQRDALHAFYNSRVRLLYHLQGRKNNLQHKKKHLLDDKNAFYSFIQSLSRLRLFLIYFLASHFALKLVNCAAE